MQCIACACVFKPLFGVNILFGGHVIYFVIQLYKTYKMQRSDSNQESSNQDLIDYSPVPDSPTQSHREPEMLNPSMRSDSYLSPRRHSRRRRRGRIVERRVRCRPSRRHRRPPPPPPPAASTSGLVPQRTRTVAAHGGRKTLKNRSRYRSINRSRKCKSTRRK